MLKHVTAVIAGVALCAGTSFAGWSHQGNQRIIQLAQILSQQAQGLAVQANAAANGWGATWADKKAARELAQFAGEAQRLARAAQGCGGGNNGGWNGGGHNNGGWNGGGHNNGGWNGGGHNNGGWNGNHDQQVGQQLERLFRDTWRQASDVQRVIYAAPRLRPIVPYWNQGVGNTLQQLRQALNCGPNKRDSIREVFFDALFGR